jgi:eukaryotic-like serine/threonine-protein kinase
LKKIGKYELLSELGHGAMGVVYRARDPIINRLVALKTITTGVADDPALLERFYREAQSAGGLQHPNIVTIYDMGEAGDLPYIAMELVEGENLEQVIASRTVIPITLKLIYAMQACRAFDYAHKRGIVHRDIKPGNVMLGKDGTVKVVDFGIARVLEGSRTQTGMLLGTFAYMSPEQYHGEHADERSDIWSFGVLLYELLCYERPFRGPTPASLMNNICNEPPRSIKDILPECSPELEAITVRILQKSPRDRYQSMEDVLQELDPVCKKLQIQFVADLIDEGRGLLEQGEFAQAREVLRQALQVEAGNPKARILLDKANTELRRLLNRPNAELFVEKARALLSEGKFKEAKNAAEGALQLDSSFLPALEVERVVAVEIERARVRAENLDAASQRLAEGLPDEAEVLLATVLQAEPHNERALALQEQVEAEKAQRQARERLAESLRQARELWTQQNYGECIALLVGLEQTFPSHEEVSRLLESAREDQIEQHKQQGLMESRNLLAGGHHEECLALLGNLQREFPRDEEIPRLLEDVRRDQKDRRRLQRLAEARGLLAAGQFESCLSLLTSMRLEFPEDEEIVRLSETARQNREEQRRQQVLTEARKHLAARSYEKSTALLTALEKEFPADEEINKLQETIRHEQTEERKHKGLGEARNLLAAQRYEESISSLAGLEKQFPGDEEILRLQRSVAAAQTEDRKQQQLQEARNLLTAKDYVSCITLLDSLHKEFPAENEVQKLLAAAHKEQAEQRRREGLAQARKFLASAKYDECLALLQKLQTDFPADAEVRRLLQSTNEEKAEQRKQKGLAEARSLLAARRYPESIAILQKLQSDFPAETEIRKQLATAREDLAEQDKQKVLSQARSRLAAQSFGEALTLLDELAKKHPKDSGVLKLHALVLSEQEKHQRNERIKNELEALKKLMSEKKYPEVLIRTRPLLVEFPGESNFIRLEEFATNQQAAIERELLLRKTLEEAKSQFHANRFEDALRSARKGLQNFPENPELTDLLQQAETQQRKLEVRQQIETRIKEIRVKINREKFSEAVDLAEKTLVTLGPNTDLNQLLTSAKVEIAAREKKRIQEQTFGTIRTLMESGKFDEATLAVQDALKTEAVESFDPRLHRLAEQIKDAQQQAEQKLAPADAPSPPARQREYAFLEPPPAPQTAGPVQNAALSLNERPATTQPSLPQEPVALPPEVLFQSAANAVPPPIEHIESPPITPSAAPHIPSPSVETHEVARPTGPVKSEVERRAPTSTPFWRKPAVLALAAVIAAASWLGIHFSHQNSPQPIQPASQARPEPPPVKIDPLEVQQREALAGANKLIAANDLDGARQKLQSALALNGPLTSDIQKKLSEIDESIKDTSLRQLRQNEEKLWQQAMSYAASGRFNEAQKDLRQVIALPAGGVHREEAQSYLDKELPQRILQASLLAQARQALKQGDLQSARQTANQLKQNGGNSSELVAEIDKQEQAKLGQLESQFNQLKQRDDDAAVQQLKALQPKFQALASDGSPQSGEASNYANAIPSSIADVQASILKKSSDAAFQRTVQKYQQAASTNDKNGLTASRNDFQSVIQNGGPHVNEAQKYRVEIDSKLAALDQPDATPAPPPARVEIPVPAKADNDGAVRAVIRLYGQAFQQKDADALRRIWPSLGDKYGRYKRIFESASSIQYQVNVESVVFSADGTKATVTGNVSELYTPKGGKVLPAVNQPIVFHLEQTRSGVWVIDDTQ